MPPVAIGSVNQAQVKCLRRSEKPSAFDSCSRSYFSADYALAKPLV